MSCMNGSDERDSSNDELGDNYESTDNEEEAIMDDSLEVISDEENESRLVVDNLLEVNLTVPRHLSPLTENLESEVIDHDDDG